MIKVQYKELSKKEFEKEHGKNAGAIMQGSRNIKGLYRIQMRKGWGKEATKKLLQHELGHVFVSERNIIKRIPQYDRRKLKQTMTKERIKAYKQRGAISGKAIMQEGLADVYCAIKHGQPYEKKFFKEYHPKVYNVISQQIKKFKPKIIR